MTKLFYRKLLTILEKIPELDTGDLNELGIEVKVKIYDQLLKFIKILKIYIMFINHPKSK